MSAATLPLEEDGLAMPRRAVAAVAVLAAIALAVVDTAIANVALPTMAAALGVSPAASVWVVTGYQLAVVVTLLPAAALGESLGYRRVFVAGVALFTAASVLCALSPSLPVLVGARFLQGLGSACVMSLMAAMVRHTYPHRLLGRAIGWTALTVALASAAGPTIGAAILSVARWPWLFAVNLPIGAVVLLFSPALPATRGTGRRLDRWSVALNAGLFAPIVVGVDLAASRPALGLGLVALGIACGAALVRREWPLPAPLIPLDLLRAPSFALSVVSSVCCFSAATASFVALPFYLEHGLGQDAVTTGFYMTPWPLTVALAAPLSGRLAERVSTGLLCGLGGACLCVGLSFAALWPLHGTLLPLVLFTVVSGFGFGLFQTPNNRNMLLSAPKPRSGAAGGMQATARLTGQTLGAVLMSLLFALAPAASAPRIGLGVAAALALLGGAVSLMRVELAGR
ncbi:MFS transporter [Lichenibacterium dinghuense]|uniref:MFS transporter n=1 Tax=Lichenibacterium dinghuense TaxID=2895977 RepID=UPI001F48D124|nr:MFS transporter [Lichenibacterium sp. 6Y81]